MAESTAKGSTETTAIKDAVEDTATDAKSRFGKAIDDAKASAEKLREDALERGTAYKDAVAEKAVDWSAQAKEKGMTLATEGKAKASDALTAIGKTISDTAGTIDEKLGVQYGDYARSAARGIQETAAKLEAKDIGEIGEDVKAFVRKSPATAIGIAAVAGFFLARLVRGSDKDA